MRLTFVALAAFTAGFAFVPVASAQSLPADFLKAREERIAALANGDRAAFDRLTTAGFVVADPGGRVENKAERGARVTPPANPPQNPPAPRINERSAIYNNDTVLLFWQTKTANGVQNFMETWVREGGQWKCAAAHISRPAAPEGGGAGRGEGRGRGGA
jgi:hypothetical protein